MRTDNDKVQLTESNVNEHLDSMDLDVVDKRNIGANESSKSELHLHDWEMASWMSILLKRSKLYVKIDGTVTVFW